MEIESDLKLLKYTDTEVLMDDFSMSMTDFMSRFEKFKVDEVSIAQLKTDIGNNKICPLLLVDYYICYAEHVFDADEHSGSKNEEFRHEI